MLQIAEDFVVLLSKLLKVSNTIYIEEKLLYLAYL